MSIEIVEDVNGNRRQVVVTATAAAAWPQRLTPVMLTVMGSVLVMWFGSNTKVPS